MLLGLLFVDVSQLLLSVFVDVSQLIHAMLLEHVAAMGWRVLDLQLVAVVSADILCAGLDVALPVLALDVARLLHQRLVLLCDQGRPWCWLARWPKTLARQRLRCLSLCL